MGATELLGSELTIEGLGDLRSPCPYCDGTIVAGDVVFAGMPVLADAACSACGRPFWLHWPTGHALLHPVLVDRADGSTFHEGLAWYPRLVDEIVRSRASPLSATITTRPRAARSSEAVLVNCLDTVFGHSILKLLGALPALKLDPPRDLVVVVPSQLSWLVPPAAGTTIEVDVSPEQTRAWIAGLDEAVKAVLSRYETVEIDAGISQPELTPEDLSLLRRELTRRPEWPPTAEPARVTFVLRDDRRWVGNETRLLRALRRLSPRATDRVERRLQNHRVRKLAQSLKARLPEVEITVIGVAATSPLPEWITDLRTLRPTPRDELGWCAELVRTRTAVGVHGSHLLLPSTLAAAVVDLVPPFKLPNLGQDLVIADESAREPKVCLFRYRMLPADIGIRALADVIVSTLRDADYQYWTIVGNRDSVGTSLWPRPPGRWHALDGG